MRDWKNWFKAAGIRAIKTMAQTAIGVIGAQVFITEVNWLAVASASAMAGVVSLLTSIAGLPEEDRYEAISEDEYEIVDRIGEDESDVI